MRLCAATVLLAATGCQVVFSLDDDKLQFRRVISADADQATTLTFERPDDVADLDVLIAVIHSPDMDETEVVSGPPELKRLAEGVAANCGDDWHTTFFAGLAGTATSYEFAFNMPESHYGLIGAYANASRASLIIHRNPDEIEGDPVLPATMTAPGSILWFGGGASQVWTDNEAPLEMTKRGSNRTIAMFERRVPDGVVPDLTLALSHEFCAGVAEIAVEP